MNPPDQLRDSIEVPADVRRELDRVAQRLGPIGHPIHWLATTGSTNDVASRLAEVGATEGTTVVAEAQTAGRGRHGRAWFSPAGAGLYASVILRPSNEAFAAGRENPIALLTLAAGVAIADAVRIATGLPAEIKWPNDVMIGRRKLAGILAESAGHAIAAPFIVLGFGINLQEAAYPVELAARATSIEAETNRSADRAQIFAEILACMAERHTALRAAKFDAILSDWRRLAPSLRSALIEWDSPVGVVRGRAEDIDGGGALLVRVGDRIERLIAGEIRWI